MKKITTLVLALAISLICLFGVSCFSNEEKVEMLDIDLSSEEYAFAVKKGDTELLGKVNEFFTAKKTEIDAIFAKYTAEDADLTSFGSADIRTESVAAEREDELVVATNLDFAPFEYANGNKIAGIDMEIAQLLADYMNKTLVIVHMDFDAVVTSVATLDAYDIGIAGLTINPTRAETVDFSDAYFGATQVVITKKGDTTFADCKTAEDVEAKLATLTGDAAKCGGQTGTTSQFYVSGDETFGFAGFANLTFSPYASAAQAVQDMINGNIAFVVVDKTPAQALVNSFND